MADQDNPWGKPRKKKKKPTSPRGGGSGGNSGGPTPPDLDQFMQEIQDKLNRLSGGDGGGVKLFGILAVIALGLWLMTGFHRVLPEEHGVVLRFGEHVRTQTAPGLGYHLPYPIERVVKPNVTFERRIEIGYRGDTQKQDIASESLMLTGDENIIDIDFVVLWQVAEAESYLFNLQNQEATIKKVAESALREIIGRTKIQAALTESRAEIEQMARDLIQSILDGYKAGVQINEVQLQSVNPPEPVLDAFDDVQNARQDRSRLENEAKAYRNDIIPRARGQAEEMIQQAEAYRQQVINRATGQADRFASILSAYNQAKEVTSKRLYLETLEQVIANNRVIISDGKAGEQVIPYLPMSDLGKRLNSQTNNSKGSQ
jgi:membrane protease subunit HflK